MKTGEGNYKTTQSVKGIRNIEKGKSCKDNNCVRGDLNMYVCYKGDKH